MSNIEIVSENTCFGGVQGVYSHASTACKCQMTFAVFTPRSAKLEPCPVLLWLSGLTCTHENAMTKAGAQNYADAYDVALVFPDTSPRGKEVADDDSYDLGQGAGFYVDATETRWAPHFNMWSYVGEELPALLRAEFPRLDMDRLGVTGHSMGGHGALTLAMRNPDKVHSVSAFAPIVAPSASGAWGEKQLAAYLGPDKAVWAGHDASLLMTEHGWKDDMLIDQGAGDQFLDLLRPEAFAAAIAKRRQPAVMRLHAGYDHSYYFIASFIEEHIAWHSDRL